MNDTKKWKGSYRLALDYNRRTEGETQPAGQRGAPTR